MMQVCDLERLLDARQQETTQLEGSIMAKNSQVMEGDALNLGALAGWQLGWVGSSTAASTQCHAVLCCAASCKLKHTHAIETHD